jgi:hypothetical protein
MSKMKYFIVLFFFIISASGLSAQDNNYDIVIKRGLKTRFYQNDKKLSYQEFNSLLILVPDAQLEMKKAREIRRVSGVVQVGFQLLLVSQFQDQIVQRGRPNWLFFSALTGVSLLVQIPFSKPVRRHIQNAADIYNTKVVEHRRLNLEFGINIGVNGIGLSMTF